MSAKDKIKTSRSNSEKQAASGSSPFRAQTILVPIDFSDSSRSALNYAFSLAQQSGGKLVLLYANEPVATPDFAYHPLMREPEKFAVTAEQQLKKICEQEGIAASWIKKVIVPRGVAHAQITEAAKKLGADLIVIATHGNTGLKHVLLGSTTERVVRHAPCPVLVVRV